MLLRLAYARAVGGVKRRRSTAVVMAAMLAAGVTMTTGCRSGAESAAAAKTETTVDLTWTLSQRLVGPSTLIVTLRETAGSAPASAQGSRPAQSSLALGGPLEGATVRVEGFMTHPGMAPIEALATASGQAPGAYRVDFAFTMAGDWVLLVTATLPDGRRIERRIDVPNVRPAA